VPHSSPVVHFTPAILVQTPSLPFAPQLSEAAHAATPQHTPSVQKSPEGHSEVVVHAAPSPTSGVQAPALQKWPGTQSAFTEHVVRHDAGPHTNSPHDFVPDAHAPAPSHVPTRVSTPPAHEFAPHEVVVAGK
jgi:hypothetical protein